MINRIQVSAAFLGAGTAILLGIAPATAAEIDDLKAKVEALEKKVGMIESTSVSVTGYVKGDFYIDSDTDLGNSFGNSAGLKLDGEPGADDDGAVGAHANQSRIRFGTSTDTDFGALSTVLEGDMWNDVLRLRLAYGALGPVLAQWHFVNWQILPQDYSGLPTR